MRRWLRPARALRFITLVAAACGLVSIVQLLARHRVDLSESDGDAEAPPLHEAAAILEREARRIGPGEQGAAVLLRDDEQPLADAAMAKWFMNLYASDKISLDRSLRDQRSPACRALTYDAQLPKASVIIIFTDEAWSPLLRTVHSVVNRTPRSLLHEIVLVDDFSQREELGAKLKTYLRRFGSTVKLIRSAQRLGLIVARLTGAQHATGEVLVFIDAHCEASRGWLEPLLQRLVETPKAFVCPTIDYIDAAMLSYSTGSAGGVGSFWWSLHYSMAPIPPQERQRRKNPDVDPLRTPTMAGMPTYACILTAIMIAHARYKTKPQPTIERYILGGLFAARRDTFFDLGAYDDKMEIWGGENLGWWTFAP